MLYHDRPFLLSQIIVTLVRNYSAVDRLKRSLLLAARIRLASTSARWTFGPGAYGIAWTAPPGSWEPPPDRAITPRAAQGGAS